MTHYLTEHAPHVHDPARLGYAAKAVEGFIAHCRSTGKLGGAISVDKLNREFVQSYGVWRQAQGINPSTIRRELAMVRAAVNFAAEDELITMKPHIPKLKARDESKVRGRRTAYNMPQIAALLEAAWSDPRRHHVHLFIVTKIASVARTEAILECDLDAQYFDGVIDWLIPGEEQTKKRRSMTPVSPSFAAWLEGRAGKLIRYRAEIARRRWADPEVPEFHERDCQTIKRAFETTLIEAGKAHPSLRLVRPVIDAKGSQVSRIVRVRDGGRYVDREEPLWEGIGHPNMMRHSVHTQLRRIGVPKGQLDAAEGHAEQGTGEHYNAWDAKQDLKDFVAGVEQLFDELRQYTTCHLRSQNGPKIIDLGAARAAKSA